VGSLNSNTKFIYRPKIQHTQLGICWDHVNLLSNYFKLLLIIFVNCLLMQGSRSYNQKLLSKGGTNLLARRHVSHRSRIYNS